MSKESVIQQINIVKISTNYKQPRQSVVRIQLIKSYWKSRTAYNSSCIFLERDPCLRRATKIVATEVRQVKQTVTAVTVTCCGPHEVACFHHCHCVCTWLWWKGYYSPLVTVLSPKAL